MNLNKQPVIIALWSLLLLGGLGFAFPATVRAESALDFIGPLPGYIYRYESDCMNLILRGVVKDEEGAVIIEETYLFPPDCPPVDGGANQRFGVYGLLSDGTQVKKKVFELFGDVLYTVQLDLEQPFWGRTLIAAANSSGKPPHKTEVKCRIIKQERITFAGKERLIIEVGGEHCLPRTYASGIGLIRYAGWELVKIQKNGYPIYSK